MKTKFTQFNKFTLIKKIAHGGMAEIFLACIGSVTQAQRFVVLKKILPSHSNNKEFAKMFKNEGKIVANLSHSNVASIYEFGIEKNQHFICMEYISGRHLRQLANKLSSKKLLISIPHTAHIIRNICLGLDYAHNYTDKLTGRPMNIIHRDISPQNIMIGFNGEIKLIDFGIAKAMDTEATRVGVLKGKLEYMSPEQVKVEALNPQTDIFSLGSILWELLAGKKLFTATDELSIIKKIKECHVPDLKKIDPKIPNTIIKITNKSLQPDKNNRYKTIAHMANDLSVFLNKEFPNFTATHFNSFIKELYIEEILEERQYLRDCATALENQKKETIAKDTSSAIYDSTEMNTFIGSSPEENAKASENNKSIHTKTHNENPDTIELSSYATEIEQTDVDSEYTETQRTIHDAQTEITKTKFEDDKLEPANKKDIHQTLTHSKTGAQTTTHHQYNPKEDYTPYLELKNIYAARNQNKLKYKQNKPNKIKWLFFSLVAASIAWIFIGLPHEINQPIQNSIEKLQKYVQIILKSNHQDNTLQVKPKTTLQREPSSLESIEPAVQLSPTLIATKDIFVDTKPAGATIYIDNKKISNPTPTLITIPANKKILITVRKNGYYPNKQYISTKTIKDKISLQLKRIPKGETNEIIILQ